MDPIKIGWLGACLDGPGGSFDKIHRMAFDEAVESGLLDRPYEFVLHAENGLPNGSANLGTTRLVNFSTIAGDQFISICPPGPTCGGADFDGDGDTGTDFDIEAFFACLGGNCCGTCGSADFDGDGDVGTDFDIEAFFRVLGGGTC